MIILAFVAGIAIGVWSCVVLFIVALLIVGSPRVPDNERAAPDDEDADDDILGPYGLDGRPADSPRRGLRLRDEAGDAGRSNHHRPAAHAPHRSPESGGTLHSGVHPVRAGRSDPDIVLEYVIRAAERRGRELLEAERKERAR